MDEDFYWKRHPDSPFAALIRITTTYLHPEADDPESLQRLAKREDRPEMRVFKAELRQAITPTSFPATSSSTTSSTTTEATRRSCDDSGGTSTATNLSLVPGCAQRHDSRFGMGWNWRPVSRLRS